MSWGTKEQKDEQKVTKYKINSVFERIHGINLKPEGYLSRAFLHVVKL